MVVRKYFTLDDAEALLPRISPLISRAQRIKQKLESQLQVRKRIMTDGSISDVPAFDERFDTEFEALKERFYDTVERIEKNGCVIRDIDQGVIDFYSKFEHRDVFLCWELGTRKIRHWHELDEDFSGRKRILELR